MSEETNVKATEEILEKEQQSTPKKAIKVIKKAAPYALCVVGGILLKTVISLIGKESDGSSDSISDVVTETIETPTGDIEVTHF